MLCRNSVSGNTVTVMCTESPLPKNMIPEVMGYRIQYGDRGVHVEAYSIPADYVKLTVDVDVFNGKIEYDEEQAGEKLEELPPEAWEEEPVNTLHDCSEKYGDKIRVIAEKILGARNGSPIIDLIYDEFKNVMKDIFECIGTPRWTPHSTGTISGRRALLETVEEIYREKKPRQPVTWFLLPPPRYTARRKKH